jgi:hypothetical protein
MRLDVLNLFNTQTNQIEYLSRLPGKPIDGVADRHVHPVETPAVRVHWQHGSESRAHEITVGA